MRRRHSCWSTSAPFRCEWRPSRWLAGVIVLLGTLGAFAALNCDLPARTAWPLALAAIGWALLLLRREQRRPGHDLLIPPPPAPALLDGRPCQWLQLRERGPLLVLRARLDGRTRVLLFWPDILPRPRRRELRLAVRAHAVSRDATTVAP